MDKRQPRAVWHLDGERRVTPRASGQAWRVVAADRDRVDPTVTDYLFCAPDFLFPCDGVGRALRLEIDPQRPPAPTPRRRPAHKSN